MTLDSSCKFKQSDMLLKISVNFKFDTDFKNRLIFQIPKFHKFWTDIFVKNKIQSLPKITKIAKKNYTKGLIRTFKSAFLPLNNAPELHHIMMKSD